MTTILSPRLIYEKYINGDSLTDAEVSYGAAFYGDLADGLILCGPTFRLAFKEAAQVYDALEGFQKARMKK